MSAPSEPPFGNGTRVGDPEVALRVTRPPLIRRVGGAARGYVDTVSGLNPFELGAAMTLVMVVVSLHEPFWYLKLGIATLAVAPLVVRPLMRNPLIWLGLVGMFLWSFTLTWPEQNNHDFLKLYWCLGVGASLLLADPGKALRVNARALIGLCFLFATLWKVLSADYVNNAFFNYFLLQDSRFSMLAEHLGGLDARTLIGDRTARAAHTAFGDPTAEIAAPLAASVRWIAPLMTWWTVLIEGAIAAAFLLPSRFFLAKWRDVVLFVFVLSTYFVAPILYFAWILLAMGVVQCDREALRYAPAVYAALFIVVLMRFYVPA